MGRGGSKKQGRGSAFQFIQFKDSVMGLSNPCAESILQFCKMDALPVPAHLIFNALLTVSEKNPKKLPNPWVAMPSPEFSFWGCSKLTDLGVHKILVFTRYFQPHH